MARFEHPAGDPATYGNAGGIAEGVIAADIIGTAETCFKLGLQYANGREVVRDNVEAHKWFNIAAMKGDKRAAVYRQDLAEEMSRTDVARAQRAAREWLSKH